MRQILFIEIWKKSLHYVTMLLNGRGKILKKYEHPDSAINTLKRVQRRLCSVYTKVWVGAERLVTYVIGLPFNMIYYQNVFDSKSVKQGNLLTMQGSRSILITPTSDETIYKRGIPKLSRVHVCSKYNRTYGYSQMLRKGVWCHFLLRLVFATYDPVSETSEINGYFG